ncbi:hypothetical protein KBB12_02630 [Candidatus Woesebacteria bacterium]|nr:hypothetical protein [Candidatus Woesebacteria bacterium]
MNHKEYRNLFKPQSPNLLEAQNGSPKWNVSQMVADLGHYGRYKEAKMLAGADRERMSKSKTPLNPRITGDVLTGLRADALVEEGTSVWAGHRAFERYASAILFSAVVGTVYSITTGNVDGGFGIVGGTEALVLGPRAVLAGVRAHHRHKLHEDEAVAGH